MIEVKNLTKKYGEKCAVDNISFTVNDGEILGFLGPNGAGKSTTMNILTGYLSSSVGEVKINGIDILENPIEAKKNIGYLPEQPPLYMDMTVKEYLNFMYDLKKVKQPRQEHIAEICRLVKITDVYKRMIKNLSKGYKQRVGMAQALLGNPEVLILDEPTVGLDPKQIIEIRNLIKKLGKRHTVILSSHILPEVQATCDRIIVISQGKIVADDTEENLSKIMSKDTSIKAKIEGDTKEITELLKTVDGVKTVTLLGKREPDVYEYQIDQQENADVRRGIFAVLCENNKPLLEMKTGQMSLEEIFLKLTNNSNTRGSK